MVYLPNNPSDEDRYHILKKDLKALNRLEDFPYIIQYTKPPLSINNILPKNCLKGKRVGVIGAGLAGLSSSYELSKLGCDITILEANPKRIGGRIYTYFFEHDLYGELGAMRIPISHESSWHYIKEFKLSTNPFIQTSENNVLYVKNKRFFGLDIDDDVKKYLYPLFHLKPNEQKIPLTELIEYVYNQPLYNTPVELRPLIIAIRKKYPKEIKQFDQITFRKNCELLGLSRNAIDLVNRVIGTDSGVFYYNFLEILKETYPVSTYNLYEITGGFYKLVDAFKNALEAKNVEIRMGQRVLGIYDQHNHILIKAFNTHHQIYENHEFDYLICAIPFSTLRLIDINPLFSNEKMSAIREINYSPAQKTILLFNERFWERSINNQIVLGGKLITDLPITTAWFPSHRFKENKGVLVASYNMSLDSTRLTNVNEEYTIYEILRQLESCYGLPMGYLNDKVLDYKILNWNKYSYTLGAFAKYYTEQNELFAYSSYVPEYRHKIYFAGEHISPFHGWVQGALQSGMMAANLLASWVKKTR